MAQYPRGPAKQHLTFFDGGLEYNSSGPFNGANNVLKGEELRKFQDDIKKYGYDETIKKMLVEQAKEAMRLQSPNYNTAKGPLSKNKHPRVLHHTKPVSTGSPPEKQSKKGGKYSKNVYKKVGKKEVLGKERVIYKVNGSSKEFLKSKDMFIPVTDYKKIKRNNKAKKYVI